MQEPLDSDLTRLFDTAHTAQAGEQFLERVRNGIDQAERARRLLRIGLGGLVLVLAIVATPWIADSTVTMARYAGDWLMDFNRLLISPVGWACSLLAGLGILRWTGVLGR